MVSIMSAIMINGCTGICETLFYFIHRGFCVIGWKDPMNNCTTVLKSLSSVLSVQISDKNSKYFCFSWCDSEERIKSNHHLKELEKILKWICLGWAALFQIKNSLFVWINLNLQHIHYQSQVFEKQECKEVSSGNQACIYLIQSTAKIQTCLIYFTILK